MQQEQDHDLAPLLILHSLNNPISTCSSSFASSTTSVGNIANEVRHYRVWFEEYTTGLERDRHMSWLQKRMQTIASHVSKQACNEYDYDQENRADEASNASTDIIETSDECEEAFVEECISGECSYSVVMTEALLREVRARPEVRQVSCE